MDQTIDKYILYTANSGRYSRSTSNTYRKWLEVWDTYFSTLPDQRRIDAKTIEGYKFWLLNYRGVSNKTMAHYLIVLRLYMDWRKRNKITPFIDASDIDLPKNSTARHIEFVTEEEVEEMITWCKTDVERAVILTLFHTGVRLSELLTIPAAPIALSQREVAITGKGDKTRPIFVSPRALRLMKKVLNGRDHGMVFTQKPRTIQKLLSRIGKQALDRDISPHVMRHGFATWMLGKGVDITAIQKFLGHASIMTTMMYVHITNKQLKDIHQLLVK